MATALNVNITDDAKATRIIDAVSATYAYQAQVPDLAWADPGDGSTAPLIPNPQTKKQFTQQEIKNWLREITRAHEINAARETAAAAADTIGNV